MPVSLEKLNNSLIKLNIASDFENKSLKRKSSDESILVRDPSHPNGCVFKTLNQKKKNENSRFKKQNYCKNQSN